MKKLKKQLCGLLALLQILSQTGCESVKQPTATERMPTEVTVATAPTQNNPQAPECTESKPTLPCSPPEIEPVETMPVHTEPAQHEDMPPAEEVPTIETKPESPSEPESSAPPETQPAIEPTLATEHQPEPPVIPAEETTDATTTPVPEPTECIHDWQSIYHSAEGHWVAGVICDCGWTAYGSPGELNSLWNAHSASYPAAESLLSHGGYRSIDNWITDIPAYEEWYCTKCGEQMG